MGNLKQDIGEAADQIARALRSSNYRANFSPQSLWDIDLFFDDHSENGAPKANGLLSQQLGARLFALGGYVGETIRRNYGGEWHADDADPNGEINISLKLPDGSMIWPVQRVMKRLKNGPEDGIAVYGSAAGLMVGEKPAPFSPYRSQASGASPAAVPDMAPRKDEYGPREHKILSSVLLFLASALGYSLVASLVATFFDPSLHNHMLPTPFLAIDIGLFWGGTRLWSGWRAALGWIWLCFCPLALFNAFYFRHIRNDPLLEANESHSQFLAAMSNSALVMAALAVIVGTTMLLLHRAKVKAEADD